MRGHVCSRLGGHVVAARALSGKMLLGPSQGCFRDPVKIIDSSLALAFRNSKVFERNSEGNAKVIYRHAKGSSRWLQINSNDFERTSTV